MSHFGQGSFAFLGFYVHILVLDDLGSYREDRALPNANEASFGKAGSVCILLPDYVKLCISVCSFNILSSKCKIIIFTE